MPESVYQKEATNIFAIRERNQADLKHASAVENAIERLEVFGTKVIAAHLTGVPLNNRIVQQQAAELVNAVLGITRETVN